MKVVGHAEHVFAHVAIHTVIVTVPAIRAKTDIVTIPSKTTDVEQTLQIGVHDPRKLHVIWIDR
ncbi:MAG: hypothetical protein GY896_11595 [Gammaproteobacteria bacterium]|nr:hypothetical protein [Gammaproteobacteria bacterium]